MTLYNTCGDRDGVWGEDYYNMDILATNKMK